MQIQLVLTYSGSTDEVNYIAKKYNIVKSNTSRLKDQDITYLSKDESRQESQRLSDNVVMTLMEPFMGKAETL